jgi:hypothetical protein
MAFGLQLFLLVGLLHVVQHVVCMNMPESVHLSEESMWWWIEENPKNTACRGVSSGMQANDANDPSSYYICCGDDQPAVRFTCYYMPGLAVTGQVEFVVNDTTLYDSWTGTCTRYRWRQENRGSRCFAVPITCFVSVCAMLYMMRAVTGRQTATWLWILQA